VDRRKRHQGGKEETSAPLLLADMSGLRTCVRRDILEVFCFLQKIKIEGEVKDNASKIMQDCPNNSASASMKYDPSTCALSRRADSRKEEKPLSCKSVSHMVTKTPFAHLEGNLRACRR
jgi:hypothetical protein